MMDGWFENLKIAALITSVVFVISLIVASVVHLLALGHVALALSISFVFIVVVMTTFITVVENL